jgi:hypothetical protein
MLITKMYLAALWAVALMVPHVSQALPILEYPENSSGYLFLPGGWQYTYDADTGVMSYRLNYPPSPDSDPDFRNVHIGENSSFPPHSSYSGFFSWTATISQTGQVLDPGSAVLALELGSGLELVATGSVVDFGFRSAGVYCGSDPSPDGDPTRRCILDRPRAAIAIDHIDPRFSDYLGNYWISGAWVQLYQPEASLSQSFRCTGGPDDLNCTRESHDIVTTYRVAEPGTLPLLGLGLLALGLARRRSAAA